ncbi:hypothetical protein Bhyg_02402 [Pseudolycoriella hygida]|uniref:Uncharacterized protein n=1 Tax=Pseudolycoriella hygida TaxID=35572 RepID=A0A9Q0S6H1_9DIPT|nr:hypothetical protein Bhyg_02402 [Pseudolycoriella hygida]
MNKFTIILLASLVTLIQIASSHPVPAAEVRKNDDAPSSSDNSNKRTEQDNELPKSNEEKEKDYGRVMEAVRRHLSDNFDVDEMSEETETRLIHLFREMNIA